MYHFTQTESLHLALFNITNHLRHACSRQLNAFAQDLKMFKASVAVKAASARYHAVKQYIVPIWRFQYATLVSLLTAAWFVSSAILQ